MQNNPISNAITSCNFNNSLFSNKTILENLYFEHSVFYGSAFIDSEIKNVTFFSCTLTDTIFSNMSMENVKFNDLNIDYAVFDNVYMNNVILPFSQITFSFGLLPYLMKTKDNVYITSVSNSDGYITIKEYLALLPYFEKYYFKTEDFFPLANIYLSQGELDKAKSAILKGILFSITNNDFRQIKYLCKLIYTYSVFSFHERKQIYDYINFHISFCDMNPDLLYKYNVYKNEIDCLLLNNNKNGIVTCEIDIWTNVYPNESIKLGELIAVIEQIIEQDKSQIGEHRIVCRHNSAEEIMIILQDIYSSLEIIIPTIYSVLLGIAILDEKGSNRKKNAIELKYASELKALELEEKKLVVAQKKIEYEKEYEEYMKWKSEQQKKKNYISNEILRGNITNNQIEIKEISHITYGDIPPKTNSQLIQFSSKNHFK